MNYTKGPWVRDGIHWYGSNGEMVVVSDGPAFGSKSSFPRAEANANLIEAAPDLLEALDRLVIEIVLSDVDHEYIESHFRDHLDKARTAINKAKGISK